ncbi:MAG: hypothetical protein QOJ34_1753, partial [Pseudonocardiales bacterium]|nr:hypothetical protein [Pseudonocardiales bacterium]
MDESTSTLANGYDVRDGLATIVLPRVAGLGPVQRGHNPIGELDEFEGGESAVSHTLSTSRAMPCPT